MATVEQPTSIDEVVDDLRGLVRGTRRRLRRSWVGAGTGVSIGIFTSIVIAAAMLDLLIVLPTFIRMVIFLALVAVTVACAWSRIVRPLLRRPKEPDVAFWVERTIPNMHSRLVSALDLSRADVSTESPDFYRMIVLQAAEKVSGFEPDSLVDQQSLRRAKRWAMAATAVLIALMAVPPFLFSIAVARVIAPWADIPPASLLRFEVDPGDKAILQGEPVTLTVAIAGGKVDRAQLEMRGKSGPARWTQLAAGQDGQFVHTIADFQETLEYRIHAGRTWTRAYRLELVRRPVIASLRVQVEPPEYLANAGAGPVENRPEEGAISAPVGSEAIVRVQATGEVMEGELELFTEQVQSSWRSDPLAARVWFDDNLPPGSKPNGTWQWDWSQRVRRTHTEPANDSETRHAFEHGEGFPVRAGDVLFTDVWIDPARVPTLLRIEFWDGATWNRRVAWGIDSIRREPSADAVTSGPVPAPGKWVRIEIPAKSIDMEGKTLRGLAFCVQRGLARWDSFGACAGVEDRKRSLIKARSIPLALAEGWWTGRFPLERDELYHIVLRNSQGHTNKQDAEYPIRAIVDRPPTVHVERPKEEVTVSSPIAVPLVAHLGDDFGLAKLEVVIRKNQEAPTAITLWNATGIKTSESVYASIELRPLIPKHGDVFACFARVGDRKGQSTDGPEFRIRYDDNPRSLDKEMQKYQEEREKVRQQLADLVEKHEQVSEKARALAGLDPTQKLTPQEPPASQDARAEASDQAKAKAQTEQKTSAKETSSVADRPAPAVVSKDAEKQPANPAKQELAPAERLTPTAGEQKPKDQKSSSAVDKASRPAVPLSLEQVRQGLNEVAQQEEQARNLAKEVARGIERIANRSDEMDLLPPGQDESLRQLGKDFDQLAERRFDEALKQTRQAAEKAQSREAAKPVAKTLETVQEDLEALAKRFDRMESLQEAMTNNAEDLQRMLEEQNQSMLAENAQNNLESIQEAITELQGEVGKLQDRQTGLENKAEAAPNERIPEVAQEQQRLEDDSIMTLEDVQELLEAAKQRNLAQEDAPMPAEQTPGSEPVAQETPSAKEAAEKAASQENGLAQQDPNGAFETVTERRKRSKSGNAKQQQSGKLSPESMRERLAASQKMLGRDLEKADQMLSRKSEQLQSLLDKLQKLASTSPAEVDDFLRSPDMREPMRMSEQMRQMKRFDPLDFPQSVMSFEPGQILQRGFLIGSNPNDVDLAAEAAKLKLSDRERQELIQALGERGPDSYRRFIRDYYNKLTRIKPDDKK